MDIKANRFSRQVKHLVIVLLLTSHIIESSFVTQNGQVLRPQVNQPTSPRALSLPSQNASQEKLSFEELEPETKATRAISIENDILEELRRYHRKQEEHRVDDAREAKEKEKKDALQNQWTSESQVFSAISVVVCANADHEKYSTLIILTLQAVFIASLSVSLTSLARDTYEEQDSNSGNSMSQANAGYSTQRLPSTRDNVYSYWYVATFISLLAGCLSGLAAAVRSQMASDTSKGAFPVNGPVDRALGIVLLFVTIMMAMAAVTLVIGLLFFTWTVQSTFVAVAMSTPGAMFTIALPIAVVLYLK